MRKPGENPEQPSIAGIAVRRQKFLVFVVQLELSEGIMFISGNALRLMLVGCSIAIALNAPPACANSQDANSSDNDYPFVTLPSTVEALMPHPATEVPTAPTSNESIPVPLSNHSAIPTLPEQPVLPVDTSLSKHINLTPAQTNATHNTSTVVPQCQGSLVTLPESPSAPVTSVKRQRKIRFHKRPNAVATTSADPLNPIFSNGTRLEDMQTAWGYGVRENKYNDAIFHAARQEWPIQKISLPPLLFKSIIATESAFNPTAESYTGAAGLTQLTPETARKFGLNWSMTRDPKYAVPAGVKVLAEKARVILEPENYTLLTGVQPSRSRYASLVAEAYRKMGTPNQEQSWYLILAAYNAGGGTILRAMANAYTAGKDPRQWSNLVGDASNPTSSPLYKACQEIFPYSSGAKYREIADYPVKIMKLYKQRV